MYVGWLVVTAHVEIVVINYECGVVDEDGDDDLV